MFAPGQSALLQDGAAFSLISSRPDLAITVKLDPSESPSGPAAGAPAAAALRNIAGAASPALVDGVKAETPAPETLTATSQPRRTADQELDNPRNDAAARLDNHTASQDSYPSPSEVYTSDGGAAVAAGGGSGDVECAKGASSASPTASGAVGQRVGGGTAAGTKASDRQGKAGAQGVSNGKPPARMAPPVLLLLAGLPGSGKSTLSRELLAASPVAWVHVNQDAIRSGKPGTRKQCITAARAALEEGACCVVDRCHADAAQRASLRAVAEELGLAAHCVALQLPLELCVKRVAGRSDHPGGVQGDGSKRIVYTMASQMKKGNSWPPAESEGFTSVMNCHSDADVAAAVRAWAMYGIDIVDAQVNRPVSAVATTAEAANAAGKSCNDATATSAVATGQLRGSAKARHVTLETATGAATAAPTLAAWRDHAAKRKLFAAGMTPFFMPAGTAGAAGKRVPTSEMGGAGAEATIVKAVTQGLPSFKARAASIQRTSGAVASSRATAPATGVPVRTGQDDEIVAKSAPGSEMKGMSRISVSSGVRRGRSIETLAEERSGKRQTLESPPVGSGSKTCSGTGGSAAVPSSTVQVISEADVKGAGGSGSRGRGEGSSKGSNSQAARNAFAVLMASASRQTADGRGRLSSCGDGAGSKYPKQSNGVNTDEPDPRFKLNAPWAQALRNTALYPEQAQQEVLYKDDKVVMISDAFPKAKHHALVIARDPTLRSIADLRRNHLPLLAHMQQVALKWAQDARRRDPATVPFKMGFHAVPSMCQVHLHVVSQDFDSMALKNKKHWNSFTTQFFWPLDVVKSELESHDRLKLIDQKEQTQLEGQELQCHGCAKPMKSIPELKKHIVSCEAVKRLPGF